MSTALAETRVHGVRVAGEVERRADLLYRQFVAEYLYPQEPVVLAGSVKTWPAVGKWTPRFFADRFPDREVEIKRPYKIAELVDLIEQSDEDRKAPYLHARKIRTLFPELLPDITPLPDFVAPNWMCRRLRPAALGQWLNDDTLIEFFLGGKAAGFPFLHWDERHYLTFVFQVYGEKLFYVYPPDQSPLLYPEPGRENVSLVGDVERPDLVKYPRFAEAAARTCVLGPGDTLFIPPGWWHTTRMLTASISLSTNTANAANWPAVVRDLRDVYREKHPRLATPLAAYLRAVGWKWALKDKLAGPPGPDHAERQP